MEAKADFIEAEATDFVRANPTLDMGITGVMKIARLAEAQGWTWRLHGCGPAHRHCMASIRNANYYELTFCAPKIGNPQPPLYHVRLYGKPGGGGEGRDIPGAARPGAWGILRLGLHQAQEQGRTVVD